MKYLRRCAKVLGWLILLMVGLVAVYLTALIYANWNDDALSDASVAALQFTPPTEDALSDNGYLILMGLDAPVQNDAIGDAVALGRLRLEREIERRRWIETHGGQAEGMPSVISSPETSEDGLPPRLSCPKHATDCFEWYAKHQTEIQALIQKNDALLQRVLAAGTARQFKNPGPVYLLVDLPPFGRLIRAHELWLAQASLVWMQGQPQQAVNMARQAAQLRKRLASNSDSLIVSMIALAMQYRELRWLSHAVKRMEPKARWTASKDIEEILSTPQVSLQQALEGEKEFIAITFYSLETPELLPTPYKDGADWWATLLNKASRLAFLPQQTLNISIQNLQEVQAISTLPAHNAKAAFDNASQRWDRDYACTPWTRLRNVLGICIANLAPPFYLDYLQRVTDVEGYRRLVVLQHRAKIEQIALAVMPAWLTQSTQELHNPYTLQPMQWDAATNSLVFEGRERQNQNPDQSSIYRIRLDD
jgi:hypothetical protein